MQIVRATVRAYDAGAKTATIELTGALAAAIPAVPVLWPSANATDMAPGNTVLVALLEDGTPYVIGAV